MTASVGIAGLGVMGSAMAERLLGEGWEVTGTDLDRRRVEALADAGLRGVDSAGELVASRDTVLVSVPNGEALLEVVEQLAAGARPGLLVVDTSTVEPEVSAAARERLATVGAELLCAPLSGSAALAAAGTLTAFCSGPPAAYERASELMAAITRARSFVGEGEEARVVKLIVNLVVIGTMELVAESVVLGEALGLSRKVAMEQLVSSVIGSTFLEYKSSAVVESDFEPTATVGIVRKDLGLIRRLGAEQELELPATATIDRVFARCEEMGLGKLDMAAVLEAVAVPKSARA